MDNDFERTVQLGFSDNEYETGSDTSESDYVAFNLKKYEKLEDEMMNEFRSTYGQILCDRYIRTIELRRKKLITGNLKVLQNMHAIQPVSSRTSTPSTPTPDTRQEPKMWDLSLLTVKQVHHELVHGEQSLPPQATALPRPTNYVHQSGSMLRSWLLKDNNQPKSVPEKNVLQPKSVPEKDVLKPKSVPEKDVSDEEMVRVLSKHSPKRPPVKTSPEKEQAPHVVMPTPQPNQKTRMCKFASNCRRSNCMFAHTLNEFSPLICRFKDGCKFGKTCRYFHPGSETKEFYISRCNT